MMDANQVYYQAVLSRDPRFDGVFFVGVSSTGVYCRTVCTARKPKPENCAFFPSAAAAELQGYRPCLRCRPELAPGNALIDVVSQTARAVAARIEDGALNEMSVAELAAEFGMSERQLRRCVQAEFGVSPVQLAQTWRLLMARRLLRDTNLPVTQVAFASGFSSLRRFNALFRERYGSSPAHLRKTQPGPRAETIRCELAYHPPLAWEELLRFLGDRALAGVEVVTGDRYLRTVHLAGCKGWISVQPAAGKSVLVVEVSAELAAVLGPVLARVKRLFDLEADPQAIAAQLGPLAAAHPGLRVPGAFDGFELAVRAVIGQQVSVRSATTVGGRVAAAFGEPLYTPHPGLSRLFPPAARVARLEPGELAALGIVRRRAEAIITLAREVALGSIRLEPGKHAEETIRLLTNLPGIGEWTAQYIAMRALHWPDAFPHTDLGLRKALGMAGRRKILQTGEQWRPWRAYAAMHLWHSL